MTEKSFKGINSNFVTVYSIKDLEKLCGIKAHTLRIWEQRYSIVVPQRTKTNIRYYQDSDLKKLLNISLLNKNGIKISKIAKMKEEEIMAKVAEISEVSFEYNTQLDALTISMIEMDEYKFDKIVSSNIEKIGFERTMLEIIHPFLDKLSVLWLTGSINPVQENFIGHLIRQKIITAIDSEPFSVGKNVKTFIVYLPEGENQELSLLLMHYLLKTRKNRVIYLGQNISIQDLENTCDIHKPDFIFTMITETYSNQPVQAYVDTLSENFPDSEIILSGYQVIAQNVASEKNVTILGSLQEVINFMDILKSRPFLKNL